MVAEFRATVGGKVIKRVRTNRANGVMAVRNFRTLTAAVRASAPTVLKRALTPTFNLSQVFVPVRTGALKRSGFLEITGRGKTASVQMGYGRRGVPPYALIVHEEFGFRHKPPTRAKFLEEAVNVTQQNVIGFLALHYKV